MHFNYHTPKIKKEFLTLPILLHRVSLIDESRLYKKSYYRMHETFNENTYCIQVCTTYKNACNQINYKFTVFGDDEN